MSKKINLFFLSLVILGLSISANAQLDLATSFMTETWASSFTNPAWVPEKKFHIGLPTYFFNIKGTSVDPRNYIDQSGGIPKFNLGRFANELDENFQTESQQIFHPLYLSLKLNKIRIGAEYSINNNSVISLPDDLFKLTAFGNAPYIDQILDLGPEVFSITFQQLSFPVSFQNDQWTLGIRPSMLKGIFSARTLRNTLELYTDPEYYQLSLSGDLLIESSGILNVNSSNYIGFSLRDDLLNNSFSWKGNTGFNIDLGFRYEHNDQLSVGMSIVGIGQIKWDRNVNIFSSLGNKNYNGIDLGALVRGDSLEVDKTIDDLIETFQLDKLNRGIFNTKTDKNIYLNLQYKLNPKLTLGGIFYVPFLEGRKAPAFSLNAQFKPIKNFHLGVSYGAHYGQWTHLGANVLVQLGPVQIFAATNNIITVFDPLGPKSTNLRFGLSAAFGEKKNVNREAKN